MVAVLNFKHVSVDMFRLVWLMTHRLRLTLGLLNEFLASNIKTKHFLGRFFGAPDHDHFLRNLIEIMIAKMSDQPNPGLAPSNSEKDSFSIAQQKSIIVIN